MLFFQAGSCFLNPYSLRLKAKYELRRVKRFHRVGEDGSPGRNQGFNNCVKSG